MKQIKPIEPNNSSGRLSEKPTYLTKKQWIAYEWIADFIQHHGISPTVREVSKGLGLRKQSSAQYYVNTLKWHRLINLETNKTRTIRLTESEQ